MTAPAPPERKERLVAWLRQHRGAFTDAALRERLLAAGHRPDAIEAALAELRQPPPAPRSGEAGAVLGDALLGYLGALLAIVALPLVLIQARVDPNTAAFVGGFAFLITVFGWVLLRDSDRRGVAKGLGYALVTVIVVPIVAVVGIFGYCLVVGPQFA